MIAACVGDGSGFFGVGIRVRMGMRVVS